jgi:hypothetical protein
MVPGASIYQCLAADGTSITGLQEVTVTARKRELHPQNVPMSTMAVVTAHCLQADGVQNVQDLQFLVPVLSVCSTSGAGFLSICGVGSDVIGPGKSRALPITECMSKRIDASETP